MKIKIGKIMIPFLYYLTVLSMVEILVFGSGAFGDDIVLWNTFFCTIAAMPGLWFFYRQDREHRGEMRWNYKLAAIFVLAGVFASGLSRVIIEKIGTTDYSAAEEQLLTGNSWLQLLVLVGASPLLEEFAFRGVLYGRLKELGSARLAMVFSALMFGLYHGNISQGIYGFLMGLFLAWSMEYCQTVKAPLAIHAAANFTVWALAVYC